MAQEHILIDLATSDYAHAYAEGERVHRTAFERIMALIERQIARADQKTCQRRNDTLAVFGERGVGKTSFLYSLGEALKAKDVCVLPVVDPTLIEEKAHIFLYILSLIEKQVEDHKGEEEWQKLKQKLANGLPNLRAEGMTYNEPQWYEDEYIMETQMEAAKAACDLHENFCAYVDKALGYTRKKAFVLMFDDIDVDFHRGWDVLETIRKHLSSPRLIVVLSGNMKLYSKNVRKQQWLNFGKALLRNERDLDAQSRAAYTRMVNELEGQYIQKVLKSENRVFLYSMAENMAVHDAEYNIKYTEADAPKPLREAYGEALAAYGICDAAAVALFTDFMLHTSLRTQVRFLHNAYQQREDHGEADLQRTVAVFAPRMYAENIDVEAACDARQYVPAVIRYLVAHGMVEDAYQLLPTSDQPDTNAALFGLTLLFACHELRGSHLVFDFWLRLCLLRNNMRHLTYVSRDADAAERYCEAVNLTARRPLHVVMGNSIAHMLSLPTPAPPDAALPLMGYGRRAKRADADNRIDRVLTRDEGIRALLGYMPLTALLYTHKNERLLYYSFYMLLAHIGSIVQAEDAIAAVKTACQPLNYQLNATSSPAAAAAGGDEEQEADFDAEAIRQLAEAIETWKRVMPTKVYAPYFYGRLSTRFFFAQANIVESNRNKPLGELFSLFAMALVNAAIIEELSVTPDADIANLNINNVASSPKILNTNAKFLADNGHEEKVPFAHWLSACPLLYPFMNLTETDEAKAFVGSGPGYTAMEGTLHNELPALLNRIAMLQERPKAKLLYGETLSATIDLINENGLNVDVILNTADIGAAQQELKRVFDKPTEKQVRALQQKCQKDGGTGKLKAR